MVLKYEIERRRREEEERLKEISTPDSLRSSSFSDNLTMKGIRPSINLEVMKPIPIISISLQESNSTPVHGKF